MDLEILTTFGWFFYALFSLAEQMTVYTAVLNLKIWCDFFFAYYLIKQGNQLIKISSD